MSVAGGAQVVESVECRGAVAPCDGLPDRLARALGALLGRGAGKGERDPSAVAATILDFGMRRSLRAKAASA